LIRIKGVGYIGCLKPKNGLEGYKLKESRSPYNRVFDPEKCSLRVKNDHIGQVS
jgi:hypothetical protein